MPADVFCYGGHRQAGPSTRRRSTVALARESARAACHNHRRPVPPAPPHVDPNGPLARYADAACRGATVWAAGWDVARDTFLRLVVALATAFTLTYAVAPVADAIRTSTGGGGRLAPGRWPGVVVAQALAGRLAGSRSSSPHRADVAGMARGVAADAVARRAGRPRMGEVHPAPAAEGAAAVGDGAAAPRDGFDRRRRVPVLQFVPDDGELLLGVARELLEIPHVHAIAATTTVARDGVGRAG